MTDITVRRGFVDIAEGQMHYRTCGPDNGPVLVNTVMRPAFTPC